MSVPDSVWLEAPCAALRLSRDAGVLRWQLNRAALEWSLDARVAEADWAAAAEALDAQPPAAASGRQRVGAAELTFQAVMLPGGRLFWLSVPAQPEAPPGAERERAQQAISAQRARALDLAKVSVWRIDLATRRIHMNETGFGFNGLVPRPEGLSLEEIRALVHPADRPAVLRAAEEAMAGTAIVDVEARYWHTDGHWRHLLTRRVAERDAQGRVVALTGVSMDQTARIVERERAQALARRMQLVADAAGVGVWSIDSAPDGSDERLEWNAQMFRLHGLDENQPPPSVSRWLGELVHPSDRARAVAERRRVHHAHRSSVELELRIVRPDAAVRWVVIRGQREECDGRVLELGIALDVTQQRALDEALRLQQYRLKLAAEGAGVGIWERDLASGEVLWEEQMYRLRGLNSDDPRSPLEIDEQIMTPQAFAERRRLLQRHQPDFAPYEFEFEVRWPDGSVRWLASTGRAVRDESGDAVRMVGLNWDITQRKRAEAAQREVEAAERASRAKSEFLARMSHELRTPLNAMLGFAQLLETDGADRLDLVQRTRLARIRSAGAHLLALIEDVLDLSAVESGAVQVALRPVALDDAADEVLHWVAPMAAERGVSLHLQRCGGWVLADARRLSQILANLLTNAVKYNHRGGAVWMAAGSQAVDSVEGWMFTVRDTGRGLSQQQRAHLFEPFNRLGAEREGIEGRGIGLMMVHHLVQAMAGRLQVASQPGRGSEFGVWLPAAAPQADSAAALAAVEAIETPPLSLLYIEDNPVNLLVVQELVARRQNLRFASAVDGISGVARALAERPDVVLVDMHLPDIDGHEVLRRLREHDSAAVCIALSANAMPEEVARARASGFDDYWTKPIDFAQFLAGLERLALARAPGARRDVSLTQAQE